MIYVRISTGIMFIIILYLVYVFSGYNEYIKIVKRAKHNYKHNITRFNEDV